MRELTGSLDKVPLFEKLSETERDKIRKIGGVKTYLKDRVIFLEGESFSGFYVVLQGTVRIYKLSSDGSETILHVLKPFKSFAETPIFTGADVYPACAQTAEDSVLFHVPKLEFKRAMEENPGIALKLTEALASRLMELNKKFGQLSVDVETRLARFILGEITSNGSVGKTEPVFTLTTSKKDLAAQLGIAVETLSRALRKLKDHKVIRESARKIFVTDVRRLQELSK